MVSVREPLLRASSIRRDRKSGSIPELEVCMILLSLGLLLLTCVQTSLVRELAVIAWLVSLVLVGLRNTGAALGIYIAAVALYSDHFFRGNFSLFERPDHPALLVLLVEIGLLRMRNKDWSSLDWLTLALGAFLVYGAFNGFLTGTFSTGNVAMFARATGIPFLLVILVLRAKPTLNDLRSFVLVLCIVAGYSAVVSALWVTDLRDLIFPTWINDPGVNRGAGGARAGGILMQPGDSGRFLSLVLCMVYLAYQRWIRGHGRLLLIVLGTALLVGIYLTYTRGVYLGVIPALIILFWQKRAGGRKTVVKRFVLVAGAAAVLSLSLLTAPTMLKSRVGDESTVVWRFEIWEIGLRMVPQRPLFGYGFGGYGQNAASFFESSDVITHQGLASSQPAVHNTFLNLMIEYGLVGFLLYASILYLLFKRAARSSKRLWGREGIMWMLAFISVYLIPSQFAVLQDPAVNLIFFSTLALLAGLVHRSKVAPEPAKNGMNPPFVVPRLSPARAMR